MTRNFRLSLLTSTMLVALAMANSAHAQSNTVTSSTETELTQVIVLGRGQPRQVQTVSAARVIEYKAPGSSPIKLLEQLPGVHYAGSDAFGTYEYAATLYLRGFSQSQLGYTLDGIPLGDMSYSNHNGLHISRAIISENVDKAQLAQGASDLDVASTSNLGGTLKFTSRQAAEKFGADMSLSLGSDDYRRIFGRVDSGELANSGLYSSLSLSDSIGHPWKGTGDQVSRQINLRLDRPMDSGRLSFWINGSQRRENDILEQSREQMQRLGQGWTYLAPNYDLAETIADIANNRDDTGLGIVTNAAAGTVYPGLIQSPDDSYYQGAGLRDDVIAATTWEGALSETVHASLSAYGHANKGQGPWFTPYVPSPNATDPSATVDNSPLSFRGFTYGFTRTGAVGSLGLNLGSHRLKTGLWIESNHSKEGYKYFALTRGKLTRDSLKFQDDPFYTDDLYSFVTSTKKFYIEDSWQINSRLTMQYGFKAQSVISRSLKQIDDNLPVTLGDDAFVQAKIKAEDGFLPQIGLVYKFNQKHEVFSSYGESIGAFAAQVDGVIGSGSQAVVDDAIAHVKPERSKTFEIGWRYKGEKLNTALAFYNVEFQDRVLAFYADSTSPILAQDTLYRNVGSVKTLGLEAALQYRFSSEWNTNLSYTRNDSKYQENVVDDFGVITIYTKDKVVAGAPSDIFKADLTYDNGHLFGSLSYAWEGRWYYTYENDNPIKSHDLIDLTAGYRFHKGQLAGTEISLNASNLLDRKYISTFAGLVSNDPDGTAQVLFVGAPRSIFVTLRRAF